jgi:hypothetical protein
MFSAMRVCAYVCVQVLGTWNFYRGDNHHDNTIQCSDATFSPVSTVTVRAETRCCCGCAL